MTFPKKVTAVASNNRNKDAVCQSCAPFTECIDEINNRQIDDTKDSLELYFLSSGSHLHSHGIYFATVFRFMSSILLGTHILSMVFQQYYSVHHLSRLMING